MSDIEENLDSWLNEELIPKLKSSLNKTNSKVQYVISVPGDSIFLARVYLLDLKFFSTDDQIDDEVHLVVKRPTLGKKGRNVFHLDAAFHNEILFYTKFAKWYNDYPKLYYTLEKPSYDTIIVSENINHQGYYLNTEKTNLDIKYIFAAVQEIAKFHANGYIMKYKHPERFFEIVKNIKKCRKSMSENSIVTKITQAMVPRIINYLRKQEYDETFCKKLEIFLFDGYEYAVIELQKPIEPLATLCHGDFLRNNIFFKQSNDSVQAKLIDFGLFNYGSPCQDIAHFIFTNGNRNHWTDLFDTIFDIYYEAVIQNIKDGGLTDLQQFSKEAFFDNYKINAFFGFTIAAIYLPAILGYFGDDPTIVLCHPIDEVCQLYAEAGGDELTKILVQMIFDLRKIGSLDCVADIVIQ